MLSTIELIVVIKVILISKLDLSSRLIRSRIWYFFPNGMRDARCNL